MTLNDTDHGDALLRADRRALADRIESQRLAIPPEAETVTLAPAEVDAVVAALRDEAPHA